MKCLRPIMVRGVSHPCGQCIGCRMNYARDWAIRLHCEAEGKEACFVTLTYDDEHLPHSISKREVQLFIKRARKIAPFRYFACGEYGDESGRPHYHLAIIGQGIFSPLFTEQTYYPRKKGYDVKCSAWTNGKIFVGNLTEDSANYVAGYMLKKVKGREANKVYRDKGLIPPFSLMSRKPGLGQEWCKRNAGWLKERGALLYKQRPTPLPRYFLHQIYTKEEIVEALYRRQCENFVDPFYLMRTAEYADPDLANERIVQAEKNVLARSPKCRERFNDV